MLTSLSSSPNGEDEKEGVQFFFEIAEN